MNHLEENKQTEFFDNKAPQVILKQDVLIQVIDGLLERTIEFRK